MIQLRNLEDCVLYQKVREKQPNGNYIERLYEVDRVLVQAQEISDDLSFSVYGARINNMIRIVSPYSDLMNVLAEHMNNETDVITDYLIEIGGYKYRIVTVRKNWVDLERL